MIREYIEWEGEGLRSRNEPDSDSIWHLKTDRIIGHTNAHHDPDYVQGLNAFWGMEFFNDVGGDPLKPSLFELVAQEQLRDLLQPALKYVLGVSTTNSLYYTGLLKFCT